MQAALLAHWKKEEARPFIGWDFSYLEGRMLEETPPWSYLGRARELLLSAEAVLDIGTGGGERLLELRDAWPRRVTVTEGHPPNLALARERLEPLGVEVVDQDADEIHPLPFPDHTFDLVLNRHAALHVDEIARVLRPGGRLLTQQVHGQWAWDLLAVFGATPQWPEATPENYLSRLENAGLLVEDSQEWRGRLTFLDVGALVYYLKAVPWLVPGFSVETHQKQLLGLQARLLQEGQLDFEARKYLIQAVKPLPRL